MTTAGNTAEVMVWAATEETATEQIPLSSNARALLQAYQIDAPAIDAALAEMRDYENLTREDVIDVLRHLPELAPFREGLRQHGGTVADVDRVADQLTTLYEAETQNPAQRSGGGRPALRTTDDAGGARPEEGGILRAAGAPPRRSEPLANAEWRAAPGDLARSYHAGLTALREAGLNVEALQAAADSASEFARQTGGSYDAASRTIQVVLASLGEPTPTDLEVLTHEAVHALFDAQPEEVRAALHRAVAKLPATGRLDPLTNRSLQTADPVVRMEERLAVLMQGEGIAPGEAKGFAQRLVRFVKDLYFRTARAVAMALGAGETADAFAQRYFRNRLDGLLQGDYAPQSLVNALGGRKLTFPERAALLPGFGRVLGRMANGAFAWEPKVPDTAEAVAHNLDLAFSRPPPHEAEVNLRKGVEAVNAVIADKTQPVRAAMFRPEVGSVTFEWGEPGDPARQFRGGFGLSHILARRALVGGMKPEEAVASLVETIAYGDASAPYGGEDATGTGRVLLVGRDVRKKAAVRRGDDRAQGGTRRPWRVDSAGWASREKTCGGKRTSFRRRERNAQRARHAAQKTAGEISFGTNLATNDVTPFARPHRDRRRTPRRCR